MNMDELQERIRKAEQSEGYWGYLVMIAITEELYEAMDAKGWDYGDLAQRIGIKKSRLRHFFACSDDMKVRDIVKIAWALELIPTIGFRSKDECINDEK